MLRGRDMMFVGLSSLRRDADHHRLGRRVAVCVVLALSRTARILHCFPYGLHGSRGRPLQCLFVRL